MKIMIFFHNSMKNEDVKTPINFLFKANGLPYSHISQQVVQFDKFNHLNTLRLVCKWLTSRRSANNSL